MLRIAICDDSEEDAQRLKNEIALYNSDFEVTIFKDSSQLLNALDLDLLFLDIYMPGQNGIDVAKSIRRQCEDLKIVFVSSSIDHYPQAYEVFAFNYLTKPLDRDKLFEVLDRANSALEKNQASKISFQYKSSVYSVAHQEILYLESKDKLVLFHLVDGRTLQCYGKLEEIARSLPEDLFNRCHQSFIVGNIHINEMGGSHFRLGQVVIHISKKYLKPSKDRYYAYLFGKMKAGDLR